MQIRASYVVVPSVWNGFTLALRLLHVPRTLSDMFYNQLKTVYLFTVLESGASLSSFPEEVLYKSLNERTSGCLSELSTERVSFLPTDLIQPNLILHYLTYSVLCHTLIVKIDLMMILN